MLAQRKKRGGKEAKLDRGAVPAIPRSSRHRSGSRSARTKRGNMELRFQRKRHRRLPPVPRKR